MLISCKEKTATTLPTGHTDRIKKTAKSIRDKAITDFKNRKFNTAFYNFNKSRIYYEIVKDSTNIIYILGQMGYIQQINGDYYGSKETLTEALPYTKKRDQYTSAINNYFGIAEKELSNYDDAIFYYKEAIKDASNDLTKQSLLNNVAVVYTQQKKYTEAISMLESVLRNKNIDKDLPSKTRVLDNLGYAYFKNGSNEKGLLLMLQSYDLRLKIDDPYGNIEASLHLAEYYLKSNPEKSSQYAKIAYRNATEFNSIDERLEALSFLISNESAAKEIQYVHKFIFLNDSIIRVRNNFKNKFAKIKYDSKKEKDENQKLRLEKTENSLALQEAKYQKLVAGIGIIFLIIAILVLIRYYRHKNRIEKIRTSYDTETRIAKDIHDELANDVFYAITFTQTQSLMKDEVKDKLLEKLDHIYSRVRGISRENNNIDTGVNYLMSLKDMLSAYNTGTTNIITNSIEKINWEVIDEIKKITIYRVLQELMVNMKKHSGASLVVLKFINTSNTILIDYIDNGKGFQKEKIIKNGLQNMENRILAIKGTITFDTEPDKGFKVKITLPK